MTITESAAGAGGAPSTIKINDIGMTFGQEYYTVLSREPTRLHLFYTKASTLLHGEEGDLDAPVAVGMDAIQNAMQKSLFAGCRFIIHNIDCHPSLNGGILVNVLGQMQPKGERSASRSFAQTFFLAEQPSGYFILNDNLRFLMDAPASTAAPATATASTAKAPAAPAPKIEEPAVPVAKSEERTEPAPAAPVPATAVPDAEPVAKPKKVVSSAAAKKTVSPKPAEAEPEEQISASGPSSWAQLAAVQANKWASGVVAATKGTSIPSETSSAGKTATSPAARRPNGASGKATATTASSTSRATSNASSTSRAQSQGSPSPSPSSPSKQLPFVPEAALYITGITEQLKADTVRAEFAALGALTHFDINFSRGCAFVEYVDPAIAKLVLDAGSVTVNKVTLTVGKRRVGSNGTANASGRTSKDSKKFSTAGRDRRSPSASASASTSA